MKNSIKYILLVAIIGIIVIILIAESPKKLFESKLLRSEKTQKTRTAAGVKLLKEMEEKDLYAIEEEIESVQEQFKEGSSISQQIEQVPKEESSGEQDEAQADIGTDMQETTQTNVQEITSQTMPESTDSQEGQEVRDPSNYRIPLVIPEGAIDYCAGVDVNAYHYREIYANSVIMGDSIAESLAYYNVIDASSVTAKIGASMRAVDAQLDTAVGLGPKNVFLYFGLNDVEEVKSDYDRFRREYGTLLGKVKQRLPNAYIYANLLFPVVNPGIAGGPEYENLAPYNEIIKEVCAEYQVTCLDSTGIVKEEYFEPDGCHFKYQFYPCWLYSMALQAGLLS